MMSETIIKSKDDKYQRIFKNSVIPIWCDDFTQVTKELENIRENGVTDLLEYLDNNPEHLTRIAEKLQVVEVNEAAKKLFKANEIDEFQGLLMWSFRNGAIDIFKKALCAIWDKKRFFESKISFFTSDNEEIKAIITFQLPADHESYCNIPISIIDMTNQIATEAKLRDAEKMRALGQLAGGIAHDFNNLLTIILANVAAIKLKADTPNTFTKNIENIEKATDRSAKLVSQILSYSRKKPLSSDPTDLSAATKEMVDLLRSTIPRTINFISSIEPTPLFVGTDTVQLQQVVLNLCTNAIDAIETSGLIELNLDVAEVDRKTANLKDIPTGKYAKLSISDSGKGIPETLYEKVFEPFFTTKARGKGTGMGLSVVHGIVKQTNGYIKVDSTLERGTTIDIYFPVLDKKAPKALSEGGSKSATTQNARILFVDDEVCIRETCHELLESTGYSVTSFDNSLDALNHFQKNPDSFDLVFSDYSMPDLNGVELAKKVLLIRPKTKVVLCSGYSSELTEETVKDIGIAEFCLKPLTFEKMISMTNRLLA